MTLAELSPELAAWLTELDESAIIDWANRGLLRRGHKASDAAALSCSSGVPTQRLEGHTQKLTGVGFAQLECSCPATGPCHHRVALLIGLMAVAQTQPAAVSTRLPEWLEPDSERLDRRLGPAHVRRAQRLLWEGIAASVTMELNALVGTVTLERSFRVWVPRTSGLAHSTCSCGAERCVHRAVVVYSMRRQHGLFDAAATGLTLKPEQVEAVASLRQWLLVLAASGRSALTPPQIERGEALAVAARQAGLSLPATLVEGLSHLLRERAAGRDFATGELLNARLARTWLLLRAIGSRPPARPLLQLAGSGRASYQEVLGLELIAAGAEGWRTATGQEGVTVHLYAPVEERWYRITSSRKRAAAAASEWSAESAWKREYWVAGLALHELPGSRVLLERGWVSLDGRLSARDDTRVVRLAQGALPPVTRDFNELRRRFVAAAATEPLAPAPRWPLLLQIPPDINAALVENQWWRLPLAGGFCAAIPLDSAFNGEKRRGFESLLDSLSADALLFGRLFTMGGELLIDPIGIYQPEEGAWRSATLKP